MSFSRRVDYTKSRSKAQLANMMTLMNLSFGIIAIVLVSKGGGHVSLLFIALAALFDRFDGMVARKFHAESDFGKELDSLCDLVSFGVAPAVLIYQTILYQLPAIGLVLTVLYILCGAIRLARFNVTNFDGAFFGIPITAAGIVMVLSSLLTSYLPIYVYAMMVTILMVLMISNIRVLKF